MSKTLTSLLLNLMKISVNEKSYNNHQWLLDSLKIFFVSIETSISTLLTIEYDNSNQMHQSQILDLVSKAMEYAKIKKLSSTFLKSLCAFFKTKTNEQNIEKVLKIFYLMVDEVRFYMSSSQTNAEIVLKYCKISLTLKEQIIFFMKNYEKFIIADYKDMIWAYVRELKWSEKHYNNQIGSYYEVYDIFLSNFSKKIENYDTFDEDTIEYYSYLSSLLIEQPLDDVNATYERKHILLELLVKILVKSEKFDLNNPRDLCLVKMCFTDISSVLMKKKKIIEFPYFYDKYWPLLIKSWSKTFNHEKGNFALRMIDSFTFNYDTSQSELALFFVENLHQYLAQKIIKKDLTALGEPFQSTFSDLLVLDVKKDYKFEYKTKLIQMIDLYFTFAESLSFLDWFNIFSRFSIDIMNLDCDLIFTNGDLKQKFFDIFNHQLNFVNLKKLEQTNCQYCYDCDYCFSFDLVIILERFVPRYKSEIIQYGLKFEFLQILSLIADFCDLVSHKIECENIVNTIFA
ncbi:unnamed protein product [Brachionus calyciflorus]|uniref:Uncharacterized protein n=1 Tax=Brachionus calyciflorus TaxID=104777 RepID=A0A814NWV1_9BILA|nr:unnamed protein product [Brachionus calyciflorus]